MLTRLLGELGQDEKGHVNDEAREDWNSAVHEAMVGGAEAMTQLHL